MTVFIRKLSVMPSEAQSFYLNPVTVNFSDYIGLITKALHLVESLVLGRKTISNCQQINLLDSLQKKAVLKKQCKYKNLGFPDGLADKESACQCKRYRKWGFDPGIRKTAWSRKWQLTLLFLPGKSLGQRILVRYSPWGCKESDMIE